MTADADLMAQISALGAEQIATARRLDELDEQLRPLIRQAGTGDPPAHYPTELAGLTRWGAKMIRLIIDPAAAQRGRKARDPGRVAKRPGRKPRQPASDPA